MGQIENCRAQELFFDVKNPRLVEFEHTSDEKKILNILWDNMAVNEIVMSILANGFFENEAMYVVIENGKKIVVEGNRRLAAVKAILDPSAILNGGMNRYQDRITQKLVDELTNNLPVIILHNREETWRYIGFKHVNGAVKWDSYAKAEYIAQVHNEYGIELKDIAEQIGDSNKITLKLYQGLMVLRQASRDTEFKIDDVYYKRVYFSHVYTAVSYEGFQKFLGIDITNNTDTPVPDDKLKNLEEVMYWLLGSNKKNIKPVIRSQNPDLRNLNNVLHSPEAIQLLRATKDLDKAYETSIEASDIFYQAIVEAKMNITKALSKISVYDGDEDMLKTVIELADGADALYSGMKEKYKETRGESNQRRTLD